jgi:hypothetical protein
MAGMPGIFVVLFALFAGVGYYRGWLYARYDVPDEKRAIKVTADNFKRNRNRNWN